MTAGKKNLYSIINLSYRSQQEGFSSIYSENSYIFASI